MDTNHISNEIMPDLGIEFQKEVSDGTLRLNAGTVNRILKAIYNMGYTIVPSKHEASAEFESSFDNAVVQWAQLENNEITYLPTDQIILQLRGEGWVISPGGGVTLAE